MLTDEDLAARRTDCARDIELLCEGVCMDIQQGIQEEIAIIDEIMRLRALSLTDAERALIAELRAAEAKATPGPWQKVGSSLLPPDELQGHWKHRPPDWIEWMCNGDYENCIADGNIFVLARNSLLTVLDLIERLDQRKKSDSPP